MDDDIITNKKEMVIMFFGLFKDKPFNPTQEEKASAPRVAVKYWLNGEKQKAMDLCKKYGIGTDEFSRAALAAGQKQSCSVTDEEKASALRVALKYWNSGEHAKAMKICKKYGISDRDFSYAMVAQMNRKRGNN